jgi:hypothetical protein
MPWKFEGGTLKTFQGIKYSNNNVSEKYTASIFRLEGFW